MTGQRLDAAIVVSARWTARPELRAFAELLQGAGVDVVVLSTMDELFTQLGDPDNRARCVIIDATPAVDAGVGPPVDAVAKTVARVRHDHPGVVPLVAARGPSPALISAAFRAGAADVIDPSADDALTILKALDRAAAELQRKLEREQRIIELQRLIEDFLRILVKAERRSIELEDALAPEDAMIVEPEGERVPRVLLIDDEPAILDLLTDMLARVGVSSVTADSGERALELMREAVRAKTPFDLALVDKNLPGIDGFEVVTALRKLLPGLPTMVMTGYSSADSAIDAANLGVVGYVLKPFSDVRELSQRIKEAADRYANERRERRFLARIKQRHGEFLGRYQRLAAELARLKE